MGEGLRVEQLIAEMGESLELTLVAGKGGLSRLISVPRIQKPGLALAGYHDQLDHSRLLSLGGTEIDYLATATAEQRALGISTMMASDPGCVVIARNLTAPAELLVACDSQQVPLFVSALVSSELINRATRYLQRMLSPSISMHGVLLDVLGIGVLLLGKSGIGKSEAALDLVVRGHRLVADDVVNARRVGPNLVLGTGSGVIGHHMEIRGLGIINIQDLFGIAAVRDVKKVELVIELSEWDGDAEYDRLGTDDRWYSILGEELPLLQVPVRPGRNIATIIEVAARNQLLKAMGHHSAREFQDHLDRVMAERGKSVAVQGEMVE